MRFSLFYTILGANTRVQWTWFSIGNLENSTMKSESMIMVGAISPNQSCQFKWSSSPGRMKKATRGWPFLVEIDNFIVAFLYMFCILDQSNPNSFTNLIS